MNDNNNNGEAKETQKYAQHLASAELENNAGSSVDSDIARKVERQAKLGAHLNSERGTGNKRSQLLNAFWDKIWKELESIGWVKVEGVGEEDGAIYFLPPTSKDKDPSSIIKDGRRCDDYYDRIQDLIDRFLVSNDEAEKRIAELYKAEVASIEQTKKKKSPRSKQSAENPQTPPKWKARPKRLAASSNASSSSDEPIASLLNKKRGRPPLAGTTLDISWKDGGTFYPKRSSQVGDEFQATKIPLAGTYAHGARSDLYELVWDPKSPQNEMLESLLATKVPPNKREQALVILGLLGSNKKDYSLSNMTEVVSSLKPVDGSDWTKHEKEKFDIEIFRLRKDMTALSKSMGKDFKSCMTYYLAAFKKSDAYRLLKTVCTEERYEKAATSVHGVDACAICGDGGSLLICDGCEGEYHMGCLRPALSSVPEGHWECDECVDNKLLKSREYIVSRTNLYESVHKKMRKIDETSNGDNGTDERHIIDGTILRPTSPVLAEVKKFARQVSAIFSGGNEKATREGIPNTWPMETGTAK